MQMYMSRPKAAVFSAAWANRPSAAVTGNLFFANDIGLNGVLFQANGTSWVPVSMGLLAASSVAVPLTGTLSETALATVTIPAGLMGTNGGIEIRSVWSFTNSANAKTLRARLDGIAGTAFLQIAQSTTVSWGDSRRIRNRGAANSQIGSSAINNTNAFSNSATALPTGAIDTSVAKDLVFSGQLANVGENITLESYEVWLLPG